MSADKLKQVALIQFALHGYDGASLALIANEVGMKKQSIYSHFKSKEDLFISIFKDSVEKEIDYIERYVQTHRSASLQDLLHDFLRSYLKRYNEIENTSFFMRTSFFPPVQLEQLVKEGTELFVSKQEAIFLEVFEKHESVLREGVSAESAALCYLTLMDGLFVEMLYGVPERLKKRTAAVWDVYDQIISQSEKVVKNES